MSYQVKTILYASDLNQSSLPAFMVAAREAAQHGAQIVWLNVVEPASHATETMLQNFLGEDDLREMREQGIDKIKAGMEDKIDRFSESVSDHGLTLPQRPAVRVEAGQAAETIIEVAKEVEADLIVMGSRSRQHSPLGRLFIGSTAQAVMHWSSVPLLVVPLKND